MWAESITSKPSMLVMVRATLIMQLWARGNAVPLGGYSNTLDLDHHSCLSGIPALPFCHVSIKTERPLPKSYPRELKTAGDHIRKKRLDLKLCQHEVVWLIGVDKTTVFNWERNYSSPELKYMPKVIEFLGYVPFEEPKTLGEKIVYYRWLSGMTQKELARKLGVDPTTLACWESGEKEPRSVYRKRLLGCLNSL